MKSQALSPPFWLGPGMVSFPQHRQLSEWAQSGGNGNRAQVGSVGLPDTESLSSLLLSMLSDTCLFYVMEVLGGSHEIVCVIAVFTPNTM